MKIQKLFFLFALLSSSLLSYGQCGNCNDANNSISYNGNGTFSTLIAQAYYWEICDGNATINGSNTAHNVSVSCTGRGNFTVKVTRFLNGNCIESCETYTCNNGTISTTTPPGLTCPQNVRIGFSVEGRRGECSGGLAILDMPLADENNVSHVNWTWNLGPHSGSVPNGAINQPIFFPRANWTNYYMVLYAEIVLNDGTVCRVISERILLDCGSAIGPALRTMQQPDNTFNVFPNPTTNKFSVKTPRQSEIVEIVIMNIESKVVKRVESDFGNEIDLSAQNKGVYFITVKYKDGETEHEKIILK